jgi:acyl-CoA thioester hydrolase
MARIKIEFPEQFIFSTKIPIRITDLNYGGHVGNDTVLSLIHEARVQFLKSFNYKELNVEGVSLIMCDAEIEFKAELFYGDIITAFVTVNNFSRVGFDLYYKLMKEETLVTAAKTGMICYNYDTRKVVSLPQKVKEKLSV